MQHAISSAETLGPDKTRSAAGGPLASYATQQSSHVTWRAQAAAAASAGHCMQLLSTPLTLLPHKRHLTAHLAASRAAMQCTARQAAVLLSHLETISSSCKPLQKMLHNLVSIILSQAIQHKFVPDLQISYQQKGCYNDDCS